MKAIVRGLLALVVLVVLANIGLEYALDRTSRGIVRGNVSSKIGLQVAIATAGIPRPWRKVDYYDDMHLISLSALYVDGKETPSDGIWGIRLAISALDRLLEAHSLADDLRYFTRLRRLMIINRVPTMFGVQRANVSAELDDLQSLAGRLGVSRENRAYLSIEKMLSAANSGADRGELEAAYSAAVSELGTLGDGDLYLSSVKFGYYKGYAYCVSGIAEGADDILESLRILSERSGQFEQAMFLNWDWAMLGNLRGNTPAGNGACRAAVDKVVSDRKSVGKFIH